MINQTVIIRYLGLQEYTTCWKAMQAFTNKRDENTHDEIWLLQHAAVFTQGQNGKPEHLLNPGDIPVIPVDRGGQVTYHGPGQIIAYTLVDMKRKQLNVREMVSILEKSTIQVLAESGITATAKKDAPGIYVGAKKICSVGLRIRRGCSYHGLAFNIAMELEPFKRINPCGFKELEMTQLSEFVPDIKIEDVESKLIDYLKINLGYTNILIKSGLSYGSQNT